MKKKSYFLAELHPTPLSLLLSLLVTQPLKTKSPNNITTCKTIGTDLEWAG